jgi:hypothetical protein
LFLAEMSAVIPYSTPYNYGSTYGTVGTYGGGYTPAVSSYGGMGGSMALFRERSMAIPLSQPLSLGSSAMAMPTAYPSMPVAPSYPTTGYGGYGAVHQIRDPVSKKHEKDSMEYQKDLQKCREAEIKAEKSRAEAMVAAAVYKEKLLGADKAMLDLAGIKYEMSEKSEKKMSEGLDLFKDK